GEERLNQQQAELRHPLAGNGLRASVVRSRERAAGSGSAMRHCLRNGLPERRIHSGVRAGVQGGAAQHPLAQTLDLPRLTRLPMTPTVIPPATIARLSQVGTSTAVRPRNSVAIDASRVTR